MVYHVSRRCGVPLFLAGLGLAAALVIGCGGASSSPASPTPTPVPSGVNACGAISGASASGLAIVNGASCTPGTASVPILYLKDSGGTWFASCSGTVISSTAVLTAAHCLAPPTASINISFQTKEIPSASFAASPDYNGTASNSIDVGVVIASAPIGQPIVPILSSRDPIVGEPVVIAGWGQDLFGQTFVLRAGATTLSQIGSVDLLAQYGGSSASVCAGDSGGPLLVSVGGTWTIAGVTSAVSGACVAGTNYFTNIRNASARAFVLSQAPDAAQR